MPPDAGAPSIAQQWLRRAWSNLIRAKMDKPEGVFWEDICFDAQQAAEKALKGLLVHLDIGFRRVLDLAELLTLVENHGIELPVEIRAPAGLTEYAIETRYPTWSPPVTEDEARNAVSAADAV